MTGLGKITIIDFANIAESQLNLTPQPDSKGYDMPLEKAIEHGKEKRKQYYGSQAVDCSCRPGGDCPVCCGNRQHKHNKRILTAQEMESEMNEIINGVCINAQPGGKD